MNHFKNAVLRLDQRHDLTDSNATIDVDGHGAIAEVVVRMEGQQDDDPQLVAFAERLVACYNLLDGYKTEQFEGLALAVQLADATRQCRAMAELLREAKAFARLESEQYTAAALEVPSWLTKLPASIDALLAGKLPVVSITLPANFKGHAVTLDELKDMLNQTGILWAFTAAPKPEGGEPCATASPSSSPD